MAFGAKLKPLFRPWLTYCLIAQVVIVIVGFLGWFVYPLGAWLYAALTLGFFLAGFSAPIAVMRLPRAERPRWAVRWSTYCLLIVVLPFAVVYANRLIRTPWFGFEAYRVKVADVPPDLHIGDVVTVDSHAYRAKPPQVGQVVVLKRPEEGGTVYIGRVTQSGEQKFSYRLMSDEAEYSDTPIENVIGQFKYLVYTSEGHLGSLVR